MVTGKAARALSNGHYQSNKRPLTHSQQSLENTPKETFTVTLEVHQYFIKKFDVFIRLAALFRATLAG